MKKMTWFVIVLSMALIVSACGGGEGSKEKKDAIKIGSIHPLSGGLALEGQEMRDAIQMAIDEKNDAGGIKSMDGRKLKLVASDHEGAPEKGVTELNKLERDGVVGVIGTYSSGVALPTTQEAERARVPFIVDIGSADEITKRDFKYTFRIQPYASLFSMEFLDFYKELNAKSDEKLMTAIQIYEDSVFGSSIAKTVKENAADYGIKIVADLPHDAATADLSTTINRINSEKPDMIIVSTYLRDGVMLMEGVHNGKYKPKAVFGVANGAFSNVNFFEKYKEINENIMDVNYTINPKSELAQKAKKNFKDKYDKNLGPNAAYSYTAAQVLIDAIERAGSDNRDKVREALTKTDIEEHILAQENIAFDKDGQNKNARGVLNQISNGEVKVVAPEQYKEADVVYPGYK